MKSVSITGIMATSIKHNFAMDSGMEGFFCNMLMGEYLRVSLETIKNVG